MSALKTLDVMQSNGLLDELLCHSGTYLQKQKGIRNYLMGLLMLDAGLRVGEVVQLLVTDLWFQGEPVHSLCVRREIAKKKRERTIPLTGRIQRAINGLVNTFPGQEDPAGQPWMFADADNGLPLSRRQVQRIIRAAGLRAFNEKIHPHVLRHTFATRLMQTVNIRVVQELLGHQNLGSTQIYTHPNHTDLKQAISTLNLQNLTDQLTG